MKYALITPAHNEAQFIQRTLESVVAQRVRPVKWVVVDDGSADSTGDVVRRFAQEHDWIELVTLPRRTERHFAGKVRAFNAGFDRLRDATFDILGNLDADISFDPDYFSFLLAQFAKDPELGVAGTPFSESGKHYDFRYASDEHVSGACQLFRRECFEEIGGYVPIPGGGIDWVAVTSARMRGWKTRTFTERSCIHGRPIGTAQSSLLGSRFKQGLKDYRLGGHPVWQIFRSVHQMRSPPYILGGLCLLSGFCWGALTRAKRPVGPELVRFHRGEQIARLRLIVVRATRSAR